MHNGMTKAKLLEYAKIVEICACQKTFKTPKFFGIGWINAFAQHGENCKTPIARGWERIMLLRSVSRQQQAGKLQQLPEISRGSHHPNA